MKNLLLFDLDGTLTEPLEIITQDVKNVLISCIDKGYQLAIISGSDYNKVKRQIDDDFLKNFHYIFCENGTQVYHKDKLISTISIHDYISDELLNELINFTLHYIADLNIPKKRGCFIECRKSLVNISPIGRNCSTEERLEFYELDKKLNIRLKLKTKLQEKFEKYNLQFSIGGKISIDCYPRGWSKVYVIDHLAEFNEVHFFGDMVHEGGNDHELYIHDRIIGHEVTSYKDTINKLKEFI